MNNGKTAAMAADAKKKTSNSEVKKLNHKDLLIKQIQHFQGMAKMVKNRTRFIGVLDELNEVDLKPAPDVFEDVENYKLILKHGYNSEVLSISNSLILGKFLEFIKKEIQQKIDDLDKQILA